MQDLLRMTIPARGRLVLAPRGYHLMFTGLYSPFVAGDDVPLTLRFSRAGEIDVTIKVRAVGDDPTHNH